MTAIYKRELRSYFNSMIGYIYTGIVVLFIGLMFTLTNLISGYPYFAAALASSLIILVLAVPILTMRSMAEERRMKTDQMLLTYPVKVSSVVLGKYLAMVTVYAIPLVIACLCPLIISWLGNGSLLIDYSAIFAFLVLGFMFISIGMFISSLTESQVISAVITLAVFLALFFWSGLATRIPQTATASLSGFLIILLIFLLILHHLTRSSLVTGLVALIAGGGLIAVYFIKSTLLSGLLNSILSSIAITSVISNFATYNVFDLKGILFLLSIAALFVFLTIQAIQKRRWS